MGQFTREVTAQQRASSTGGEVQALRVLRSESEDTAAVPDGFRSRTIAAGAVNQRLDVWGGGTGVELTTLRHIDIKVTGELRMRLGTVASELIPIYPRGAQGYFGLDTNITRSAGTGIWLTNAGTADVTIEYGLS